LNNSKLGGKRGAPQEGGRKAEATHCRGKGVVGLVSILWGGNAKSLERKLLTQDTERGDCGEKKKKGDL